MVNLLNPMNLQDDLAAKSEIQKQLVDEEGFGKSRWTFDDDGFRKARVAALDQANAQLRAEVWNANADVINASPQRPTSVTRSIDGVDNAPDDAIKL